MIKYLKKYYSPFILVALFIVSTIFLAFSINLVNAKVWVLYADGKREIIEIQTSNNGENILQDVEPMAYWLGYVSLIMFAIMTLSIVGIITYKVAMRIKHKTSKLEVSWQYKVMIALLIGLAIFFFSYSTKIHYNLSFEEWKNTQTHLW